MFKLMMEFNCGDWFTRKNFDLPDADDDLTADLAYAVMDAINDVVEGKNESDGETSPDEDQDDDLTVAERTVFVQNGPRGMGMQGSDSAEDDSQPTQEAQAAERTTFEPTGYRGMLRLTCPKCGDTFFYLARGRHNHVICKCGEDIGLDDMAPGSFYCPDCGKTYKLHTNSVDAEIDQRCPKCGRELLAQWNAKKFCYEPHKKG